MTGTKPLQVQGSDIALQTFLLDFEDVFEQYLRRVLEIRSTGVLNVQDGNGDGKRPLYDNRTDTPAQPDIILLPPSGAPVIAEVKYKEKPDICNAIGAHHDEVEMETLIAPIVQVCDAISGSRPGARREIAESYIKRLKDLEALALGYPGVLKTYAIQAGREVRVLVSADKVDDKQSEQLAFDISQKIQTEMTYPGQVKVTVIREVRATAYAK